MVPLARIASLAKTFGGAYRRAVTRRTGMVSFRLVEISISESGQLPARRALQLGECSRTPASGFTLIEMIVVMLIIAVLAGLVMTGASSAFEHARKTQAKNDVTQIATAINAFYTEYGRYPVQITSTTTDAFFGSGSNPSGSTGYGTNDVLIDVLRNNITGSNSSLVASLNPRQIAFLSPGGAKNTSPPRGGIATDNRFYDPWGSQYAVLIDTNYDNILTNPYSDTDGSAGTRPLRLGAAAYSYGKNGQLGGGAALSSSFAAEGGSTGVFKGSRDVYSW